MTNKDVYSRFVLAILRLLQGIAYAEAATAPHTEFDFIQKSCRMKAVFDVDMTNGQGYCAR